MTSPLRHPEAEQRRAAVAALAPEEVAHSLGELYALLDDTDWRVRREVALAIARMRDPRRALEPLLDAVETGDVARRNAAIEALKQIGATTAAAVLARLERARGPARRFLIEVLAEAGDPSCVAPLAALLADPDPNIPPAAAESLGRIPGAAATEALTTALGHGDPVVRLAALQAFAEREAALPWAVLAPIVNDSICRRAALRACALCPDPRALEAIVQTLSDPNAALASEAAVACALAARRGRREAAQKSLHQRPGAGRVLGHLADRGASGDVRRAAVECLGLLGDPAGIDAVLRALEAPETSAAAGEALERFGEAAVPIALASAPALGAMGTSTLLRWALARAGGAQMSQLVTLAWRAIDAGDDPVAAWDVVAAVGSRDDADELLARLEKRAATLDPVERARPLVTLLARFGDLAPRLAELVPLGTRLGLAIAEVVASAGHPVPLDPLREALSSPDPGVRAAAVRALAATGLAVARDAIEFVLADEDSGVQAAAAEALGSLGATTETLEESLRAAEPRVRRAAARALAQRGADAAPMLRAALDDPDVGVVLAALDGLGTNAASEDLIGLTTHADPDVAAEALVRLRARDPHGASEAASRMLDHAVWAVRLEAVRSLEPGHPGAVRALEARRVDERDELVREAIDRALSRSRPTRGGESR